MEELNPTNAFGELLLDAIEAQYGSLDEGIPAVAEAAGLEEDELVDILQGDVIVEDESLLSDLIEALPDADEDDMELLINAAVEVDAADREQLIEAIADTEEALEDSDAGYEDSMDEEMPTKQAAYSDYGINQAMFSKISELEDKVASFELEQAFSTALKELDSTASRYVEAGILAPSHKAMLIGNFENDAERLACFAAISDQNGVSPEVMLFATQYALGMLKDASQFIEFQDYSISDEQLALANFSASLDEQVKADYDAIFNY